MPYERRTVERPDYLEEPTHIPDDWQIDADEPIYVQDDDEDALEQLIREWVYVLRHVGGIVAVTADKHEIAPGVWRNRGFAVKWNSYAPGERLEQPKPEPKRRRRRRDPEPPTAAQQTPPEADPPTSDDEGSEPDGGTVVDRLDPDEVDPDNAGIEDDYVNDPAEVFQGQA